MTVGILLAVAFGMMIVIAAIGTFGRRDSTFMVAAILSAIIAVPFLVAVVWCLVTELNIPIGGGR